MIYSMFYGLSLSLISLRYILTPRSVICALAEGCLLGQLFEINHFYHMAVWHHGRQTGVLVEQLTTPPHVTIWILSSGILGPCQCEPTGVWPVPVIIFHESDRWWLLVRRQSTDLSFWSNTNNIFGLCRGKRGGYSSQHMPCKLFQFIIKPRESSCKDFLWISFGLKTAVIRGEKNDIVWWTFIRSELSTIFPVKSPARPRLVTNKDGREIF